MEEIKRDFTQVKLDDVLSSIACSFISAKKSMDKMSAEISKEYQREEFLSAISLPFFSLSDVTLNLKFAISKLGKGNEVFVSVEASSIEKLPPHIISQIEIKLTPQPLKTYKIEEGKSVHASGT